MKIAVIPARGGSKRIEKKNIKLFSGKPIIAYSILAALESNMFDRVVVSTDDENIALIAKSYGAEVPFMRPDEISGDHTSTSEVIAHAIKWLLEKNGPIETVCCIYATAPFVSVDDIRQGYEVLIDGGWDYVFTATEYTFPIFRSFNEHPEGGTEMFFPEHFFTRSQDLPTALHDAGQFYWGKKGAWLKNKRFFDRDSRPLIIPHWRVQDIDTPEDWRRAELVWRAIHEDTLIDA